VRAVARLDEKGILIEFPISLSVTGKNDAFLVPFGCRSLSDICTSFLGYSTSGR
jgi:hypothetical protein